MSLAFDSDYIIEAMIKHGLVQLPTAQKWDEVKEAVLVAEPTLAQLSMQQIGRLWASARKRFSKTTSSEKSELVTPDIQLVGDSTEVVTRVDKLGEDPTKVVKAVGQPVGAPVQVNVYTGSGGQKGVGNGLGGVGQELKGLPDKSLVVAKIAKGVEKVVNSMLKKQVTYLGLVAAASEIVGPEAKVLLEQVTRVILELQKQFYPANLIEMRVGREFGTSFKELIGSYGRVVDASGAMPKGWEKLKLPMILNTNPEKHDQKGSETASKEGTTSPQQVPPNSQVSPQQATATPTQASIDAAKARELLENWFAAEVQHL
jgi:hypothetical protein